MKESFVFYASFYEAICELDDKKRLKMYDFITKFALKNEEPDKIDGICKQLFVLIKPQILANIAKLEQYQKDIENGKKGAIYGSLGGRPKKNKQEEKNGGGFLENNPQKNPINVNDNVNVNVNDNVNVNIPTKKQIEDYCKLVAKKIQVEDFINWYSASGWKDKEGMPINWQQKVLSWSKKDIPKPQEDKSPYKIARLE